VQESFLKTVAHSSAEKYTNLTLFVAVLYFGFNRRKTVNVSDATFVKLTTFVKKQ
jgi:hypothetical protein